MSSNELTTTMMTEFIENLKLNKIVMIMIITSFVFIIFLSLSSSLSGNCYEYFKNNIEYFKNIANVNEQASYTIYYKQNYDNDINLTYSNYKRLELLPPDDEYNGNSPLNLLFGTAEIYSKQNENNVIISCNLYILSGNIYDSNIPPSFPEDDADEYATFIEGETPDRYIALIVNENNEEKYLGDLIKDGDGLYKLNTTTTEH